MRKLILILGMPRSGNAALARVLPLLGAADGAARPAAGSAGSPAAADNVRFVALHERILERLGSRWDEPAPVHARLAQSSAFEAMAQEIARALRQEFGTAPLAVASDPGATRLIPLWRRACEIAKLELHAVVAVRHPGQVADSLRRRDGLDTKHSLATWVGYTLDAERGTRGLPRCFVDWAAVLADWRAEVARIARQLRLEWPVPATKA